LSVVSDADHCGGRIQCVHSDEMLQRLAVAVANTSSALSGWLVKPGFFGEPFVIGLAD
jgi:hypothetical protein